MERIDPARQEAIRDAIARMEWEGGFVPEAVPTVRPNTGIGKDTIRNSRFPEVVGRTADGMLPIRTIPAMDDIAADDNRMGYK